MFHSAHREWLCVWFIKIICLTAEWVAKTNKKLFGSNKQIKIRRYAYSWFALVDFGHFGIEIQ